MDDTIYRTAAYCRVSTDKEEQEGSYELQFEYYNKLIINNPFMQLVGIYGDKGKSGLSAQNRPGLQKLLKDCRAGKIDLILTKSLSRFSRNMAECVEMIRELRSLSVNVQFEKENLNSNDTKSDLILDIYAAIAQEESHSIVRTLSMLTSNLHLKEGLSAQLLLDIRMVGIMYGS